MGAFEALKRNVLRAMQLNLSENAADPSNVVESYTFTFNYARSTDDALSLEGLEMKGPHGEHVPIINAKHGLQMLVRRVMAICCTLPDLPRRRFLTMNLFYTDDCDPHYEPPGFCENTNHILLFPNSDGWEKKTTDCGVMKTGFHDVSLKVSHLHTALPSDRYNSLRIPTGLRYTAATSCEKDIDMLLAERRPEQNASQKSAASSTLDTSPSGTAEQFLAAVSSLQVSAPHQTPQIALEPVLESNKTPSVTGALLIEHEESSLPKATKGATCDDDMMNVEMTDRPLNKPDTSIICGTLRQTETACMSQVIANSQKLGESQATTQSLGDLQVKMNLQRMLESDTQRDSMEETQLRNSPPFSQALDSIIPHTGITMPPSGLHLSQRKIEELDERKEDLLRTSRSKARK
ncbi:hypothetical protein LTR39_002675, partial [Cryomyces antarcticus]